MNILWLLIFLGPWGSYAQEGGVQTVEFKKTKILLNKIPLDVEVAESETQQMRGLMFRKSLGENEGMLFVYEYEKPLTFWMKNTFIPLSIAFFDRNRELINVENMSASKSMMQIDVDKSKSLRPARYALEMKQGWFLRNNIKPGHKFEFVTDKTKD